MGNTRACQHEYRIQATPSLNPARFCRREIGRQSLRLFLLVTLKHQFAFAAARLIEEVAVHIELL